MKLPLGFGKVENWDPGWRGDNEFSVLLKGGRKIFIAAYGEQMFFQHKFPISGALVVINNTSLGTNDSKTECSNSIQQ